MHTVTVALTNADSLRLTISISGIAVRNIPYENAACREAEIRANNDPMHSKYGPWTVQTSHFIC